MNNQVGVPLNLGGVGPVVMNAMPIKRYCGITKQEQRRRYNLLTPLSFRDRFIQKQLRGRRRFVNDVLFFTQAQLTILAIVVLNRHKQ